MENDKYRSKLSAYKDGELDRSLSEEVSLHLQNCLACKKELAEFERVDAFVLGLPGLEVSEGFASQVIAKVAVKERDTLDLAHFSRRIFAKVLQLADSVFELIQGHGYRRTATLDEFGDFPPLLLSYAYFQLIGK
ncbi:putative transmembrane anti-sigma factor [Syntrophobacter sp. SbD1]|nr:putative transmembrane anti-sigma factor [Syntrophobacter sp. SbD1]